jgi:putative aminopeptidase FrvX
VVTFVDELEELNNRYFVGRALDNRMGGVVIAEVARLLKRNRKKLPFGLYIVNSVQEEVGLRGAQMIAHRIKPNLAFVTDVCHDTSAPLYDKKVSGDTKCGDGPVVTYGPAVHNNVLKFILEVAEQKEIKLQQRATSRLTGTDTDAFAYSNDGVPSALMSLPLKYMHTTVEMADKQDFDDLVKLIYEVLLQVKPGQNFKYLT